MSTPIEDNTAALNDLLTLAESLPEVIREPHPYAYDGIDLKAYFGTAAALHTALAAEDYSHIHNGDYYPITFSGTYRDYGEWVAPAGTNYYSDIACTTRIGSVSSATVVNYYKDSPAVYRISASGSTYYVKMQDCQRYREKTINASAKMEANINIYWQYGDSGLLTGKIPHICWVARDGIATPRMRSSSEQWADATEEFYTGTGSKTEFTTSDATLKCVRYACVNGVLQTYNTDYTVSTSTGAVTFKSGHIPASGAKIIISRTTHDNPWTGSAIYKTLNDPNYGIMRLITDTTFANLIIGGGGMRYRGETRTVANGTSTIFIDRGKGFLPTEEEVMGHIIGSVRSANALTQMPVFANGGRRHISKNATDGGSRSYWWTSSTNGTTYISCIDENGGYNYRNPIYDSALVPCCVTT